MEKVNKLQEGTEDTESWTSHINLTKKSKIFLKPISWGSDKNCTEYTCRGDQ
ncbi:rCG38978, partial [Rattus norvegicus]